MENWFEILPFHAGSDTVVEDLTMKYRMTPLLSISLRCGFTEGVRENINSDPVFVHQFGASGFTFINVLNRHLFNRVTTGVPDSVVREITFHQGEGSLSSLIPDERRYLYRAFDESVGEAAEEGLEPQADD